MEASCALCTRQLGYRTVAHRLLHDIVLDWKCDTIIDLYKAWTAGCRLAGYSESVPADSAVTRQKLIAPIAAHFKLDRQIYSIQPSRFYRGQWIQ